MTSIFVSICSYRDSLLELTVRDLIEKSSKKVNLTISILDQSSEPVNIVTSEPSVNLIYKHIKTEYSDGVGWARHVNSLNIVNEEYYYQIDSHCLFDHDWDLFLINEFNIAEKLYNTNKIVFSNGCKSFKYDESNDCYRTTDPINEPLRRNVRFLKENTFDGNDSINAHCEYYREYIDNDTFLEAKHLHAGNLFSRREFLTDVGIDSRVFFHYEEQILTLKSFLVGYKLLHHREVHIYHFLYDHNTYPTKPWIDQVLSINRFNQLEHIAYNHFTNILKSLSNETLIKFHKYSGVDYINKKIDPEMLTVK